IYLGALGDIRSKLSPHLRSRTKVAEELQQGHVPVTVLRAAMIIGSGSASYEIIKNLVKTIPIFLVPRWVNNKCQPIAVTDVIKYLVGVLEVPETSGESYDIGGKDILTYKKMLKICAEMYNLKRIFIPLPVSNIVFFSYLAGIFTPVPAQLTRYLMGGLKNEVVCQNSIIKNIISFDCLTYKEAIIRAMSREEQDKISTRWSGAYPPAHELAIKLNELKEAPMYTAYYYLYTEKKASTLFRSISMIGGKEGWFSNNWMWRLRGIIDKIFMGVGDSRGRKNQYSLIINDVIGFWRIEDLQPSKRLLLRAEMKLPGKAWLEFYIKDEGDKRKLAVIPYFHTKTIAGKLYWYFFLPFHEIIFNDLIKQIENKS
ncbi:MAG: SDR family oxidoreductase, partial [Candidatus Latescibacteria bacterium]|nr:SDR family oxidoreductase [Candidatus Latescibacterota bacterium]